VAPAGRGVNGAILGETAEPGQVVAQGAAAIRFLKGLDVHDPVLVFYHPIANLNPYQALLYGNTLDAGVASIPLFDLAELPDLLALTRAGAHVVLHLHWTNKILEAAETDAEARTRMRDFLAHLDAFLAAGGRLVWTVHNVLPHGAERADLEAELQQGIVERADVVHVMSANTAEIAAEWFTIPGEKQLLVPHPSYAGAYADIVPREQARYLLGIEPDETVYALLGAIKPYKGTDRLMDAFDALCDRDPQRRRLIVAGQPDRDGYVEAFLERCELHPFVSLYARKILPEEMPIFLRAADFVVLPYLQSLNSGVLMLALTFGLPVVAPEAGGIGETVNPAIARTFAPDDDHGLLEAMIAADELRTPGAHAAAHAVAAERDPATVSRTFATELAARIRGVRSGVTAGAGTGTAVGAGAARPA
jgi:beta-1,4-mannosyltransferase